MAETSARLLRLLALLQMHRQWTGTELAERLRVSTRTVRHDIDRLRELGYPVHGTRGAVGGYRLGAGASLPPLLLDDEEAVAVVTGLRNAATGAITGIEESSLRALGKLEQVLPSRLRRRVNTLARHTVSVSSAPAGQRVDAAVLSAIASASNDHERLRFDYRGYDGASSRREVEPYRLVNWGRRWYLVAWDTAREDWRTFRVERLELRTPNGGRFTPRELPAQDLADYVSRNVSAAGWRYRAQVTVHAAAEVVERRLPSYLGPVLPLDDHTCQVELGTDDLELMAVWLGALGEDFSLSDAPELAAHLRRLSERYARAAASAAS
jgi:predicted DNA-binding transcriptional regulator YafY